MAYEAWTRDKHRHIGAKCW